MQRSIFQPLENLEFDLTYLAEQGERYLSLNTSELVKFLSLQKFPDLSSPGQAYLDLDSAHMIACTMTLAALALSKKDDIGAIPNEAFIREQIEKIANALNAALCEYTERGIENCIFPDDTSSELYLRTIAYYYDSRMKLFLPQSYFAAVKKMALAWGACLAFGETPSPDFLNTHFGEDAKTEEDNALALTEIFSDGVYRLIPIEKIKKFTHSLENCILLEGRRKITLNQGVDYLLFNACRSADICIVEATVTFAIAQMSTEYHASGHWQGQRNHAYMELKTGDTVHTLPLVTETSPAPPEEILATQFVS